VLEGIAIDLKRFIAMHVREGTALQPTRAEPASTPDGKTTTTVTAGAGRSPRSRTAIKKVAPSAPTGDESW
jgi:hypothetical protein